MPAYHTILSGSGLTIGLWVWQSLRSECCFYPQAINFHLSFLKPMKLSESIHLSPLHFYSAPLFSAALPPACAISGPVTAITRRACAVGRLHHSTWGDSPQLQAWASLTSLPLTTTRSQNTTNMAARHRSGRPTCQRPLTPPDREVLQLTSAVAKTPLQTFWHLRRIYCGINVA